MNPSNKLQATDRILDVAIVAIAALLFFEGYSILGGGARNSTVAPLLMLAGFLAVLYPFRIHTRCMWLVMMPFGLVMVPLLGHQVKARLTSPPGYEAGGDLGLLIVAYALFVFASLIWILPAVLGWSLQQGDGTSSGRKVGLMELFMLTGIVCTLLVLFRDSFLLSGKQHAPSQNLFYRTFDLSLLNLCYWGTFAACIWAGFYLNWKKAIVVWVSLSAIVTIFESDQVYKAMWEQHRAMRRMRGVYSASSLPLKSYWDSAWPHTWQFAVLVGTILAARLCGYRLVRNEKTDRAHKTAGSENPMPASSASSEILKDETG